MNAKNTVNIIMIIAALVIVGSIFDEEGYKRGRQEGFHEGFDRGVELALDTVKLILFKQTESDSTVTKLTFEKDTVSYYINKKMLEEKFNPDQE